MVYIIRRPNAANQLESDQKESWQDKSLCATIGTEVFFPTQKGDYADARKICGRCDVREDCLRYILKIEGKKKLSQREGMFAGLTPGQRLKLSQQYTSQELQAL